MINTGLFKLPEYTEIAHKMPLLSEVVLAQTTQGAVKTEIEDNLSEGSTSDTSKVNDDSHKDHCTEDDE
jgi:hypothetical protein